MIPQFRKAINLGLLFAFLLNTLGYVPSAQAQDGAYVNTPLRLPKPGTMVHLSQSMNPPILKGMKVDPNNPFRFDFILDVGDAYMRPVRTNDSVREESTKLIKYFLASITTPETDLWVNLSPYEKDRIVPTSFGQTEMGRDLLAQDYLLKQVTASLIYPEDELGKKFWKRIYEEAQAKYGTTNIPVNTFNKVWIVPDKAVVYENSMKNELLHDEGGHTAYVVESRLRVMLEGDYLSMAKHDVGAGPRPALYQSGTGPARSLSPGAGLEPARTDTNALGSQIVREIVIPALTREVNEGANFAQLRQVYNSLILATWYKKKIKDSILARVYADQNKVVGIGIHDVGAIINRPNPGRLVTAPTLDVETIYGQYLAAFKKGVFNYIKDETLPTTLETIPRKYFSGGFNLAMITTLVTADASQLPQYLDNAQVVTIDLKPQTNPITLPQADIELEENMNDKAMTLERKMRDAFATYGISYRTNPSSRAITFTSLPDEAPWLMDAIRPMDQSTPIRTTFETMPVVTSLFDLKNLPLLSIHGINNQGIRLGLIKTANGDVHPATIKLGKISSRELKASQVYGNHFGVLPEFYGILKNRKGQIIGYAMSVVALESEAFAPYDHPDHDEIEKRLEGMSPLIHPIVTRKGRVVGIDAGGQGVVDWYIKKLSYTGADRNAAQMTIESFVHRPTGELNLNLFDRVIQRNAENLSRSLGFPIRAYIVGGARYLRRGDRNDIDVFLEFDRQQASLHGFQDDQKLYVEFVNRLDQLLSQFAGYQVVARPPLMRGFTVPFLFPVLKEPLVSIDFVKSDVRLNADRNTLKQLRDMKFELRRGTNPAETLKSLAILEYYIGDLKRWRLVRDRFLSIKGEPVVLEQSVIQRFTDLVSQANDPQQEEINLRQIQDRLSEPLNNIEDSAQLVQPSSPIHKRNLDKAYTLSGGARLVTDLAREEFEKHRGELLKVVKNVEGALVVTDKPDTWFTEGVPLEKTDRFTGLIKQIELRAKAYPQRPLVIVEWGCGDGETLVDLSKWARTNGVKLTLYGYGDQYYEQWEKAPKDITFILDDATGLTEKLKLSSVDIMVDKTSLTHYKTQLNDPKKFEKYMESLLSKLRNDGVLTSADIGSGLVDWNFYQKHALYSGEVHTFWYKPEIRKMVIPPYVYGNLPHRFVDFSGDYAQTVGDDRVEDLQPGTIHKMATLIKFRGHSSVLDTYDSVRIVENIADQQIDLQTLSLSEKAVKDIRQIRIVLLQGIKENEDSGEASLFIFDGNGEYLGMSDISIDRERDEYFEHVSSVKRDEGTQKQALMQRAITLLLLKSFKQWRSDEISNLSGPAKAMYERMKNDTRLSVKTSLLSGSGEHWVVKAGDEDGVDSAMSALRTPKGGVDFNSQRINLETRNDSGEIKLNIDPAVLQQFQNAPGFYPVIINIQPLVDLRKFLGIP